MFGKVLPKIFGRKQDRDVKRLRPTVVEINRLYEELHGLSDEELQAQTQGFKDKISEATREVSEELTRLRQDLLSDTIDTNGKKIQLDEEGEGASWIRTGCVDRSRISRKKKLRSLKVSLQRLCRALMP